LIAKENPPNLLAVCGGFYKVESKKWFYQPDRGEKGSRPTGTTHGCDEPNA